MASRRKTIGELRSQRWFSGPGPVGPHKHRRIKQGGYSLEDFKDKPVIAILSTWSDFQTCHSHFPQRIDDIKRGIWQAGGFPAEIPVQSVSESFLRPTSMLYRNLLAMEAEEAIRAHPVDGVVLLGGCDKTGPGLVMAAASMNVPAIFVPAGAMLKGRWRQHTLGTGSSTWAAEADFRAGKIDQREWMQMSEASTRSTGTCNTMGTASTMTLPDRSSSASRCRARARSPRSTPSMAGWRRTPAGASSRWSGRTSSLRTSSPPASLQNAVVADMAISGSTNSLIHLVAMARRFGHALSLDSFAAASELVPVICNLMPAGKHLMEDLHFAGGLMAVLDVIRARLDLSCLTVNGRTLGENMEGARVFDADVIRPLDKPVYASGALVVLTGSLAPRGAVLKRSAADPKLLDHVGPAVVFKDHHDLIARIDDPTLNVSADSVLVLQEAGPIGRAGNARPGHAADPEEAARGRRSRHGADLRCAHERHQLRHVRAPRLSGEPCRRPAGAGARRRPDSRRRHGAAPRPARRRRRGRGAPKRMDATAGALRARLRRDVLGARAASRRRLRLRLSGAARGQSGTRDPLSAAALAPELSA